jgi:transposase
VRVTRLLRDLLGLEGTRVLDVNFDEAGLVVDVAPTWRRPRCSGCGRKCRGYDRDRGRRWRHLDVAGMLLHLRYDIRRVDCPRCRVKVELVPWADTNSWFTRPFEDHVGYLAQRSDKTSVSATMRIAWETVGAIIQRVVARHQKGDPLKGLTTIGVDELSYRRHHEYITIVIDHDKARVVWAKPGKNAETLKAFFDELGPTRCAKLEAVTIDMSAAYIKAVTEASPKAQLIFDRFHVQRLAHDALDEVRRDEVRAATAGERDGLKRTRWALQKRVWNTSGIEIIKVARLQQVNRRLYRAYLLKEVLAAVLDRKQVNVAATKLDEWIAWAQRSRLAPFRRVARTIRDHAAGILAYVRSRLNNGQTEALNGKARVITRRAYGFHSAHSLIAMLKLCCSGITLEPVFQWPGSTH